MGCLVGFVLFLVFGLFFLRSFVGLLVLGWVVSLTLVLGFVCGFVCG